jgi:DNA-binding response OmpR family regulator
MYTKRILIIDDEESFCNLVKLNLEETKKYEVRTETKGANAVRAAKEFKPDLILLDIVMPDVDGGEVSQQLKSAEELKNIPIIFLTAIVTDKEVKKEEGIIGGRMFLAKPVPLDKLIYCIEENTRI